MNVVKAFSKVYLGENPFDYAYKAFPVLETYFEDALRDSNPWDERDTLDDVLDQIRDDAELITTPDLMEWFAKTGDDVVKQTYPNLDVFDAYVQDNCEFTGEPLKLAGISDLFEHIRQAVMWNAQQRASWNLKAIVSCLLIVALIYKDTFEVSEKGFKRAVDTLMESGVELTMKEVTDMAYEIASCSHS